jgi:N-glycosylase/DNA lyase
VAREQFHLLAGEELLRVYKPEGGTAVKVFCSVCGSSLFGGAWPDGDEVSVRFGSLDDDPQIRPQFHTFVGSRPPWEDLPEDGLPQYEAGKLDEVERPAVTTWSVQLPLVGARGEPVDLKRTLLSHGFVELPPMRLDESAATLEVTLLADGRSARTIEIAPGRRGHARLSVIGPAPSKRLADELVARSRHVLGLDEDLSEFYELVQLDPDLSWAAEGAGRMVRSPTVFEDVVKTICTTNCAWSATRRMVDALVRNLGEPAPGGRHAFPTPTAMAEADERFYKEVVRSGYRAPYFRALAAGEAEGRLQLDSLLDPELSDDEVAARLLALPGVGPYATAQMMMLLGRYSRLILDSWSRPKYAKVTGHDASDQLIERRFERYKQYAGLAFWLYVTRDWVAEPAAIK